MQASLAEQRQSFGAPFRRWVSAPIVWLLAAYVLLLLPHAAGYIKHHPDERHYTDAGLRMVQSGDYLTPVTPEGDLRLKKPILSYWLVAASYKLLGVSPLSSRLPFLLVGAAVVWVTYRLACYLYKDERVGLLAALVVSCQPAILISSPRSVPDIVLSFCTLLSAYGFVRLLHEPKPDWLSIAFAYGGLGLAVEAKGLPAALFGFYAVAVLVVYQHNKVLSNWKQHLGGCALAATVGLSWFATMYWRHGEVLLSQFFGDQVGERVNRDVWGIAKDLPLVFLTVACCFLPWWGALAEGMRTRIANRDRVPQFLGAVPVLLGGWSVCYLLMASCVDRVNVRYQSAIVPLLAVLAAGIMANLSDQRLQVWLSRLTRIVTPVLLSAAGLVVLVVLSTGELIMPALLGVFAVICWAIVVRVYRPLLPWPQLGLASVLTMLAIVPLTYPAARGIVGESLEERLKVQIGALESPTDAIGFFTKPSFASRLRVITGGKMDGHWLGKDGTAMAAVEDSDLSRRDVLVLSHRKLEEVDLTGFRIHRVATNGFNKMPAGELWQAAWNGKLTDYLNSRRQYLTVAVPKSKAQSLASESQGNTALK